MPSLARLRTPALVVALVGLHAVARAPMACCLGRAVPAARADHLRVVSWNLRNFPGDHDQDRMRERLDALDPQVLALQEVLQPAALEALRPGWRWHASVHGGSHGPQRLVLGWDPAAVEVEDVREHASLSMGGRVRPALSGYVRARHGGPDFHLVVVHLKATRAGHEVRRQQWPQLAAVVAERRADGPAGEDDVLVLGDFNAAGGPQITADEERAALATALAPAGLQPWDIVHGCTAYWEGRRRDSFWEPSRIDLVFGGDLHEVSRREAWPGAHCVRHACGPIEATEHHPEPDLHHMSDHCPIVVDLPAVDDDP
ncbi:MAG: endonuclease/exonuclease/phosphatase family protein [Myxococcales bacterium]|nr:endonuclease/exonuclease/phosphatase family protein [Myxococcales bacterium]